MFPRLSKSEKLYLEFKTDLDFQFENCRNCDSQIRSDAVFKNAAFGHLPLTVFPVGRPASVLEEPAVYIFSIKDGGNVFPKHRHVSTKLHDATYQKDVILIPA